MGSVITGQQASVVAASVAAAVNTNPAHIASSTAVADAPAKRKQVAKKLVHYVVQPNQPFSKNVGTDENPVWKLCGAPTDFKTSVHHKLSPKLFVDNVTYLTYKADSHQALATKYRQEAELEAKFPQGPVSAAMKNLAKLQKQLANLTAQLREQGVPEADLQTSIDSLGG